jgi:hypothetical protein
MTDFGLDTKFIHQSFRAGQSFAEAASRRKTVAHRVGDTGDARPAVLEDEAQAFAPVVRAGGRLRDQETALSILDDVARQFGRDGGEPRLIYRAKAQARGQPVYFAARDRDIVFAFKWD